MSLPAQAATDSGAHHDQRVELARSFVSKLKNKFSGHTAAAPSLESLSANDLALSQIEDGEGLLFRPRSEGYTIDYNVYAIKESGDFYFLLADVMEGLSLPVKVDNEQQTTSGWYLREDWPFALDAKNGMINVRGQQFTFTPDEYLVEPDGLYIAGRSLEKWMDIKLTYDPSQQYLVIDSPYPLPAIAQMKRRDRKGYTNPENVAQLPRQDFGYDMLSMGVADLALRTNYNRDGQSKQSSNYNQADLALNGEVLGHSASLNVNADDTEGVNAVTARLFKQSDRSELLGPLKARSYAVGDTGTVDIALTGQASQELGARVSSNPLSAINYQDTRISGNAMPGWDVELYRGDTLIDTQVVDETGRYEFNNVQLYAGDNDFDVYFYGNQGEIKKESINIPLTAEVLQAQGNTYDVSLTMNERTLYRREKSQDQDESTPRVAAKYNFFMGDTLAYVGAHAQQEEGKQKAYLGTGTTNIWKGFVFDTNLAVDEQAEGAARLGVRKNINEWNMAFSTQVQSDEFSAGTNTTNPAIFQTQGSIQKNYKPFIGTSGNLSLASQYEEYADGSNSKSGSVGLGQGFSNVSFSNVVSYNQFDSAAGSTTERIFNDLTTRMRLTNDLSVRGGVSYRVKPESQMDRYFASVNYRPDNKLNIDAEVEHEPETRLTEGELRVNYMHNRFRLSPFVRANTDRDLAAGMTLSTTLLNRPFETMPLMTSDRLIGQGSVSAFVFLDVNGSGIYDEGDEVLPEVVVESMNSRAREETNDKGYAFLKRLSVTVPTDIRVDNTTLPDPFMVSVNRGRSVLPREGRVFEMQFPVQFAGELDGSAFIAGMNGEEGVARSVNVSLIPLDPSRNDIITAKTAQDGFYLLSQVAPGQYFLTVNPQDALTLKSARPMPQLLTFTHEGTSFYAQDLVLRQGVQDIGFEMLPVGYFEGMSTIEPEYYISVDTQEKSGPLQALYRLRMKDVIGQVVSGLQPIVKEGGGTYYRVGPNGLEAAYQRCQIMSVHKLPCQVSVLPVGVAPAVSEDGSETKLSKQAAL